MNNQKMKPVWRMNTGNGVPSDFKSRFLYMDGSLFFCDDVATMPDIYFSLEVDYSESDVSAYETNRTKAAKYEREECYVCGGKVWRKLKDWITKKPFKGVCIYCNGKGATWRKINGN